MSLKLMSTSVSAGSASASATRTVAEIACVSSIGVNSSLAMLNFSSMPVPFVNVGCVRTPTVARRGRRPDVCWAVLRGSVAAVEADRAAV